MKLKQTSLVVRLTMSAAVVLFFGKIVSAQDFTVRMKDDDGKIAIYYVGRNALRNVESNPVDTDVIYRFDTGKMIRLDHKQKTYTETTFAELRQEAEKNAANPQRQEMLRRLGINPGATSITKIGPGETIAGYATEKYSAKTGLTQAEIWVTPALELPAGYYDMVTTSVAAEAGGLGPIFKEMNSQQLRGFVLKSVGGSSTPILKGITITKVATAVEKGPIPPSTFEPPAGYQKVARTR
jgi:uncharacterized protein DUF4412